MRFLVFFLFASYSLQLNQSDLVDRFHDHLQILRLILPLSTEELSEYKEQLEEFSEFIPGSLVQSTLLSKTPIRFETGESWFENPPVSLPFSSSAYSEEARAEAYDSNKLERLEELLELLIDRMASKERQSIAVTQISLSELYEPRIFETSQTTSESSFDIVTDNSASYNKNWPLSVLESKDEVSPQTLSFKQEVHETVVVSHESSILNRADEFSVTTSATRENSFFNSVELTSIFESNSRSASETSLSRSEVVPSTIFEEATQILTLTASSVEQPTDASEPTTRHPPKRPGDRNILNLKNPPNRIEVGPQFEFHETKPRPETRFTYGKPKVAWYGPNVPFATASPVTNEILRSLSVTLDPRSASSQMAITLPSEWASNSQIASKSTSITSKTSSSTMETALLVGLERLPGEDILDYFRRVLPSVKHLLESESSITEAKRRAHEKSAVKLTSALTDRSQRRNTSLVLNSTWDKTQAQFHFTTKSAQSKANFDLIPFMMNRNGRRNHQNRTFSGDGRSMENVAVTFAGCSSLVAAMIFALSVCAL